MSDDPSEPLDYVRLTRVWDRFKSREIRVSGEAKKEIIKIINITIEKKIEVIINKLPRITRGDNKGNFKRKTIKLDDLEGL